MSSHPNSYASVCYLCANYVAAGKGQLLKNRTANGNQLVANGHSHVVRCTACSTRAARPVEAVMSEATERLFRQSLRAEILRLLTTDKDIPAEKVRPGQAWLEVPGRSIAEITDLKEKLLQLRNTRRDHRLNGRADA